VPTSHRSAAGLGWSARGEGAGRDSQSGELTVRRLPGATAELMRSAASALRRGRSSVARLERAPRAKKFIDHTTLPHAIRTASVTKSV
jgi:hypothetical protein